MTPHVPTISSAESLTSGSSSHPEKIVRHMTPIKTVKRLRYILADLYISIRFIKIGYTFIIVNHSDAATSADSLVFFFFFSYR